MINKLLEKGAMKLSITLSPEQLDTFLLLYEEMKKWGVKINITALLNNEERLIEELFIDSMAPLLYIREKGLVNGTLLDIGSGGGFPGLPLQILEPSLHVTLTDSIEKKIFFIRNIIRKLNLGSAEAHCLRFGTKETSMLKTDSFDWVTSKAVTDIDKLSRWAYPFLKKSGSLICLKSPIDAPRNLPGFKSVCEYYYKLPFNKIDRELFIYEKL